MILLLHIARHLQQFPVKNCGKPGVRGASCKLCCRHLCSTHLVPSFHRCPDWENDEESWKPANEQARRREVERLLSLLNLDALRHRASALKGGVKCSVSAQQYDKANIANIMGGTNYHIPVTFEDGDTWMCRIRRRNITTPHSDLLDLTIENEVSTLKFLSTTRIPVPRVHDYGLSTPDNPLGVPYILMDRLGGRPCQWSDMLPFQKHKVLQQYSDIFIELSQHSFPSIGCLFMHAPSSWTVGPIVLPNHAERSQDGQLSLPGPFSAPSQYRRDIIIRYLEFIGSGQTFPKRRLDAYLMHLYLLECAPLFSQSEETPDNHFYLKHMDDKGDHILIDDDANITGIIDWEWAQTCPKAEAFCGPLWLVPATDFENGENAIGADEIQFADILEKKGACELADYVRNGRVEHRMAHCVGSVVFNQTAFGKMFSSLRHLLNYPADHSIRNWQMWKRHALAKYDNDLGLQAVLKAEREEEIVGAYVSETHPVPFNFVFR